MVFNIVGIFRLLLVFCLVGWVFLNNNNILMGLSYSKKEEKMFKKLTGQA